MIIKLNFLFLFIILLSTSCSRFYYTPNAIQSPLLKDKNEANVMFGQGNFTEIQAAYSPIKYLGIMGNWSEKKHHESDATYNYSIGKVDAKADWFEGAIGGYYPFLINNKFTAITNLYFGFGGGHFSSDVNAHVKDIYIQPGVAIVSPYFDIAFDCKFKNLHYTRFDANGRDANYLLQQKLIDDMGNRFDQRPYWLLEDGVTIRKGYKFVKFTLKYQTGIALNEMKFNHHLANLTLGFSVQIHDFFKFICNPQ